MTQMILSASVMIVLTVLVRLLAIHRLPKRIFVIIWGLVSVRLLIPFSLPDAFAVLHISNLPILGLSSMFGRGDVYSEMLTIPAPIFYPAYSTAYHGEAFMPSTVNWSLILLILWVLGSALFALFFLISHMKFRRKLSTSLPLSNVFIKDWLMQHKTFRTVQVRYSDRISSPLTYGVFRPMIVLPASMDLSDEDRLAYVLTHEHMHIRRFDYVWKLLFAAVLCVHWFNPLVWLMYVLTNRDLELSCDEAALGLLGSKSKVSYGLALLDLAEKNSRLAFASGFSKHALEERIRVMTRGKQNSVLGAVAVMMLLTCTMMVLGAPLIEVTQSQLLSEAQIHAPIYLPPTHTEPIPAFRDSTFEPAPIVTDPMVSAADREIILPEDILYDPPIEIVEVPVEPVERPSVDTEIYEPSEWMSYDPPSVDLANERPPSDMVEIGDPFYEHRFVRMGYADYIAMTLDRFGLSSLEELELFFPDEFYVLSETVEQLQSGTLHFYRLYDFTSDRTYASRWILERPGVIS